MKTYESIVDYHRSEVLPMQEKLNQFDGDGLMKQVQAANKATADLLQNQINSLRDQVSDLKAVTNTLREQVSQPAL